jgi:hypothetical protein
MQYFRIPDTPALNSPNSRMHTKLKVSKERVRSLMDLDMPAEYAPDMEVPLPSQIKEADRGVVLEPYFESGQDDWAMHAKVLQKAMTGAEVEGDSNELMEVGGDGELLDVERLLLEGAFDSQDEEESNSSDGFSDSSTWGSIGGSGALYSMGGVGPFAGELGDYEELLALTPLTRGGGTVQLQPLEIKESFLGQAKPRTQKEGGLNPNSSNNPTERKKRGNRAQGQLIKEGENSAVTGRRRSNDGSKKGGGLKTKSGPPGLKPSGGNSKPREAKGVEVGRSKAR